MAVVPAPVMPVMSPVYLLGFQMLNFRLRRYRGMNILIRRWQPFVFRERTRQQRRGLHGCSQRGRSGGYAKGQFQKVAAFHGHLPVRAWRVMRGEFECAEMNVR